MLGSVVILVVKDDVSCSKSHLEAIDNSQGMVCSFVLILRGSGVYTSVLGGRTTMI